jgi:hypothetical protein
VTVRRHFGGGWIWSLGLLVLAAVCAVAVPSAAARIGGELRARPALALLFGFIGLVGVPVAALLLAVTVIGIPLALLALFAYFIALLLGYAFVAVGLGDAALAKLRPADAARGWWRVLAAVAAMLLLTLVGRIPFVGTLVVVLAIVAGMGAIFLAMRPRQVAA